MRRDRAEQRLLRAAERREQHPVRDDYLRPPGGLGVDHVSNNGSISRIYPHHPAHPLTERNTRRSRS